MSDGANLTLEQIQAHRHPRAYHQWLGLKVVAVEDDGIELTATWREEWVVNLERRYTHGGILAALIDLGADWAMVRKTRPRRADHRHARRLSRRRAAGRPHHQGQDRADGRPVLGRRGVDLRRAGQAARQAAVARISLRRRRRRRRKDIERGRYAQVCCDAGAADWRCHLLRRPRQSGLGLSGHATAASRQDSVI